MEGRGKNFNRIFLPLSQQAYFSLPSNRGKSIFSLFFEKTKINDTVEHQPTVREKAGAITSCHMGATWTNQTMRCAPRWNFYTEGGIQRITQADNPIGPIGPSSLHFLRACTNPTQSLPSGCMKKKRSMKAFFFFPQDLSWVVLSSYKAILK